ncbi:hypothetical protein CPC08DRAFT_721564 [Agrocybe pediades]|nr:hypothetical protein CPC08DRAFT_721564 [Agrocybe pediades]
MATLCTSQSMKVVYHKHGFPNCLSPRISEDIHEGEYPYAAYDGRPVRVTTTLVVPLRAYEERGKVMFAQDGQNRHVAIKLIRRESDEHHILEFLRTQPLDTLKENCVLPVLDILPNDNFCFVIMPRWGSNVNSPQHRTIREVLEMMHGALKGLAFLHRNNIIHGDINIGNFLEDDFRDGYFGVDHRLRACRRAEGSAQYAIFDFDLSRKIPQEINRRDYWISTRSRYAWGTFNVTKDYAQGELEYNSFITDVGTLGIMFSDYLQSVIPLLPVLAPFFDMLTTHKLRQRFTAAEALAFFEDFYGDLSEEELQKKVPEWDGIVQPRPYYDSDRWASVPPDLAKKWAMYKEPPLPWKTRLLRKLFEYEWVYYPKVVLAREFFTEKLRTWR